jgi:type II secretory pathway component GspD/PulD (secretin)
VNTPHKIINPTLDLTGFKGPEKIHEVTKLVQQLDQDPKMVCVQTVIALIEPDEKLSLLPPDPEGPQLSCSHQEACELIEEFGDSENVKILAQPQVMTLDNQPAFIQVGERVPRVTIRNTKEGRSTATELENVGLIVGITPRISPDGVVTMEIDLERSELGPESEGVPIAVDSKGNVVRCPKIETMMVQTTVKIQPGRAVIIGGLALKDGNDRGELVMVVIPHLVTPEE